MATVETGIEHIFRAIQENDEEKLRTIALSSDVLNGITNTHSATPLTFAVECRRLNVVRTLLEKGAQVDRADLTGRTALFIACAQNTEDMVQALLEHKANPNKLSPAESVAEELDILTPHASTSCLGVAIKNHNMKIVKQLLDAGAAVNFSHRGSYLDLCVNQDNVGLVKLLCEHGCDVNAKPAEGSDTPLFQAVRGTNISSARILLEHGANPNYVTEQGNTLNVAAASFPVREDLVNLLVKFGTQLNVTERQHRVPLALCLSNYTLNENISVVKCLIQHGTIMNEPRLVNEMKLMLNRHGYFNVANLMIKGGMNVHNLQWLRTFMESPLGRKYWYSSLAYDKENEEGFRTYVSAVLSKPHSLADLSCFYIRNVLMSVGDGSSIKNAIECLPLPEPTKQFLFLEHL